MSQQARSRVPSLSLFILMILNVFLPFSIAHAHDSWMDAEEVDCKNEIKEMLIDHHKENSIQENPEPLELVNVEFNNPFWNLDDPLLGSEVTYELRYFLDHVYHWGYVTVNLPFCERQMFFVQ